MSHISNLLAPNKFVVGLTGGIASGKTTISNMFAKLNVCIVDADQIARDVVAKGSELLDKLCAYFGTEILQADKSLNRRALRNIVFADKTKLSYLNSLMHPAIREQMQMQCQNATSDYVIAAIPLLFENNMSLCVNRILVASCNYEIQVQRTMQRDNCTKENAIAIISSQLDNKQRCAMADDIIQTDACSLTQMYQHVIELHNMYVNLAKTQSRD